LFDLALSHHLYKHLLGPAEDLLRGKTHLIEVPYGVLTSLPLQVLITDGPVVVHPGLKDLAMFREAHWLIRRHAVSVIPSVSSLEGLRVHAKRHGERQRPLVGFGNPRFTTAPVVARSDKRGRSRSTIQVASAMRTRGFSSYWRGAEVNLTALRGLPELPETEQELKTVARSLGAPLRDLRFSTAATETAVKQMDLSAYRIVYFATHGLVAGEVQGLGEPALVLTPPDTPSALDDGLLTASEVAQLRLNADWVVLAACNTAAGDTPGADALSGLARAFFQAGARALLVSHWRVGSEAAAKLTTSTFDQQRRAPDIGRAEALRRAMLAYMADSNDPWSGHPGFWAPFSVVGEGLN
jgi:CHAT domain-containing protein